MIANNLKQNLCTQNNNTIHNYVHIIQIRNTLKKTSLNTRLHIKRHPFCEKGFYCLDLIFII
jgi:hypothetical protein